MNTGALTFDTPRHTGHEAQYGGELLRIFWRQRLIVLATVVLITTLAAAYAFYAQPLYKATASLLISTDGPNLQSSTAASSAAPDELLVSSQAALLDSATVARQVANSLALFDDLEFNEAALANGGLPADNITLDNTVTALQKKVEIRRLGRSAIITVTATSTSAEKAARIANKFLAEHIALQRVERTAANRAAAVQLRPQVERLRQRVIATDRAVAAYRRSNNIVGSVDVPDLSQLARLAGSLADARSSGTEAAARADAAAPARNGVAALSATSVLLNDLRRQSAELGKRVAELSAYYGPGYPELVNAQAQLASVDRRAAEEATRVARELRTEVAIGRAREGQISNDLSRLRGGALSDQTAAVRLLDLNREAEASKVIYVDLLARLNQIEGQGQLFRVPARPLARASAPTEPSFPLRKEIVGVAALGSFVLGLLLAFAFEQLLGRRVRTSAQVEELLQLGTLGMIPRRKGGGDKLYRALAESPASVFSEATRSLYLEVANLMPRIGSHVVVLTSPLPGEGKTTIALSLGAAAAVHGRRTVVIDFDLRHSGLLEIVDAPPQVADLVAFLEGKASIDDIVIPEGSVRNLFIIGVNRSPADAGSLLSTPRVARLLAILRERFDYVVINAPPLLAVRDAKTLAVHANATLLVLHWCKTNIDAALAAARYFGRPFDGAVINQIDFSKHAREQHGDTIQHHVACSSYYFDGR